MARRVKVYVSKQEFESKLKKYVDAVTTSKEKQQVLRSGGVILRNRAKKLIKIAKKEHVYSRDGREVYIQPGNLRQSMYVYRQKDGDVAVGPRVKKRFDNGEIIGVTPRTSSGFYAAALYGSAQKFRQTITDMAASMNYYAMLKSMQKKFERISKKWQRRYNL